MSTRIRILALALGLSLFALLIYRLGLDTLLDNLRHSGWVLAPVMLLWLGTYCCNAFSWRLIISGEPGRPGFGTTLQTTITGFAINYATPILSIGGEALKVAAATRWFGNARHATGSVVGYRLLFTTAHVCIMLLAVIVALAHGPTTPVAHLALGAAALILLAEAALLLSIHRAGALLRLLDLLHRVPGLGRLAAKADGKREALTEIDQQVTALYRTRPGLFWLALASELLGRTLMLGEFYLVPRSLGLAVTPGDAFAMGGLTSLVGLLMFIVPFGLGAKEAGSLGAFRLLGYDPAIGVYTAVVGRLREISWIGIGLLLLAVQRRRPAPS
ncbi:MAG: lysylphosphatidylglycerol synthase transmembrane domain-containing protein [Gemmatimonadota bacterium]